MKLFLYYLTSLINQNLDETHSCDSPYYLNQLMLVVEAKNAEDVAEALNTKITHSFDRSGVIINYTSKKQESYTECEFFIAIKELEETDRANYPDLDKKILLKIVAPHRS